MDSLPTDIQDKIYKYKQQIEFSNVLGELEQKILFFSANSCMAYYMKSGYANGTCIISYFVSRSSTIEFNFYLNI